MVKLGSWPQERYPISWMTQRLANRAPENSLVRRMPWSNFQQILNPVGQELERVNKQLTEEANNIFSSAANINVLDSLSYLELSVGMSFKKEEFQDGTFQYIPPRVYATIDNIEHEITQAQENDIETLVYKAVPSRIKDGETHYLYEEVVPRMYVSDLTDFTPQSIILEGHLHISIFNNSTWQYRTKDTVYFPKAYITGRTRKGTDITEAVPLGYDGTFKTVNQWKSVSEIFVSYLDSDAEIAIECLPFAQESFLDKQNLTVRANGTENFRFLKIGQRSFGSTLISEAHTAIDLETIQLGFDAKDTEYEIELLDSENNNISANAISIKDNFKYIYVLDDDNLYVYNPEMPFPDTSFLENESTNTRMDLDAEKWVLATNESTSINTDTMDITSAPYAVRWSLLDSSGNLYYLGLDGSKWPTTVDAWIENSSWEQGYWEEQHLNISFDAPGTYVISIECFYIDEIAGNRTKEILTTRQLMYVPSIKPEATFELPDDLKNSQDLLFDSDGKLWLKDSENNIKLLNIYFDYFIADYDRKRVWTHEDYSELRIVI